MLLYSIDIYWFGISPSPRLCYLLLLSKFIFTFSKIASFICFYFPYIFPLSLPCVTADRRRAGPISSDINILLSSERNSTSGFSRFPSSRKMKLSFNALSFIFLPLFPFLSIPLLHLPLPYLCFYAFHHFVKKKFFLVVSIGFIYFLLLSSADFMIIKFIQAIFSAQHFFFSFIYFSWIKIIFFSSYYSVFTKVYHHEETF